MEDVEVEEEVEEIIKRKIKKAKNANSQATTTQQEEGQEGIP